MKMIMKNENNKARDNPALWVIEALKMALKSLKK